MFKLPTSNLAHWEVHQEGNGLEHSTDTRAAYIPRLRSGAFIEYVRSHGTVSEIIASADDSDVIHLSAQPFARFDEDGHTRIPHVMVYCEGAGDWTILDDATVGYDGIGPDTTLRALMGIGLGGDVAVQVAYNNRLSHLRIDENGQPDWLEVRHRR